MTTITVTAKVSGYHPATGLHLEAGQEYTIDESAFSAAVFAVKPETRNSKLETKGGII